MVVLASFIISLFRHAIVMCCCCCFFFFRSVHPVLFYPLFWLHTLSLVPPRKARSLIFPSVCIFLPTISIPCTLFIKSCFSSLLFTPNFQSSFAPFTANTQKCSRKAMCSTLVMQKERWENCLRSRPNGKSTFATLFKWNFSFRTHINGYLPFHRAAERAHAPMLLQNGFSGRFFFRIRSTCFCSLACLQKYLTIVNHHHGNWCQHLLAFSACLRK